MRMTLDELRPDTYCWGFTIRLDELNALLDEFIRKEPRTKLIEQQAERLIKSEFQPSELRDFIKAVCNWGGYGGIAGRVIKNNDRTKLRDAFRSAHSHANAGDDLRAIKSLLELNGLAVSFASKHLKFLAPENAVVLDSIINKRLGYELTPNGYQAFLNDCRHILERAKASGSRERWRVSDIEMAIFEKLTAGVTKIKGHADETLPKARK
jgi:hypothetical protein